MRLQFKHQQFQSDAVDAVCNVFLGQPKKRRSYLRDPGLSGNQPQAKLIAEDLTAWGNGELISDKDIFDNLKQVQKSHNLIPNTNLAKLTSTLSDEEAIYSKKGKRISVPAFTVEMETGTGKTYTYIKTMYELYERYAWSKFIIVVPSIAIREGVYKTFQITTDHFKSQYGHACRFFIYNSARPNEISQFADDPGINVMIINSQAFNARGKDARRIYMEQETFQSRRPIDIIKSVRPIVIVDEPQSVLGSEKSKNKTRDTLGNFDPLFYINYSATHRENFNMVYRLDAIDAFQKKLVKKIEVKGVTVKNIGSTNGYLYLQKIDTYPNKSPSASVLFEYNEAQGTSLKRKVRKFVHGDNIYDYSNGIEAYKDGFTITDINALEGSVSFTNGIKLEQGEVFGETNEDDIRRVQIRETIIRHLEKERALFNKDIKVLSLFFIDEVAKYKSYNDANEEVAGIYAKMFVEEYENAVNQEKERLQVEGEEYLEFLNRDQANQVHAGYFSIDKKGRAINSTMKRGESDSSDVSAYDLIMKNKERLLSRDEPVRFIFSHSALKEGWDNPNVFQICTLRQSDSETKKRQEVGRGLRLCVNKAGERMDSEILTLDEVHQINVLTVIANESYHNFANSLQSEYAEILKNRPKKVTPDLFTSLLLEDKKGRKVEVSSGKAALIYSKLIGRNLVDEETEQLSADYHELPESDRLAQIEEILTEVNPELVPFAKNFVDKLESVFDPRKKMVEDGRKVMRMFRRDDAFYSPEFQELWKRIEQKTSYRVTLNEEEFIYQAVAKIDESLVVSKQKIIVETGLQTQEDGTMLTREKTHEEEYGLSGDKTRYDLIGRVANLTNLTRRTTALILSKIKPTTFTCFKFNPEEFIRKASALINEVKQEKLVEGIKYFKTDTSWQAEEIFTTKQENGGILEENLRTSTKHIYDKVRYDSDIERKFSEDMDKQDEIKLYAKLPDNFKIETPVGSYNPDWAIVLEKDNKKKEIYFVAETKGGLQTIDLRGKEKAKIACARMHFSVISDHEVKYDVVTTINDLLDRA